MARVSTLVFVAVVALALVCGTASVAADETAVLSRSRRFSIEGIITCLAMTGLAGLAEAVNEIETDCANKGNNFSYRVCALGKLAKLGPEYIECVVMS